jgi:tetratricopeptide (TPR) repeat protein
MTGLYNALPSSGGKMDTPKTHHPKVFISYSHDSREHSNHVRELSDRLRADGIDCALDQYEFPPSEGWPRWMDKQMRDTDFVLMICTETYYHRVMGEEEQGKGLGVRWEGHLIYQQLYDQQTVNAKFIPVLLESGAADYVPAPLQGVAHYPVYNEDGYEDLYRYLTQQPRFPKPALGKLRIFRSAQPLQALEPKERKRDLFAAQLTNLPFERNPYFTGRENIFKRLDNAFTENNAQVISGLGGLGKTQTAIEYAYRHADDYTFAFWARAASRVTLTTAFAEIARLLSLPEKDSQSSDDIVRAVNLWLESNSGWLLIFDNAEAPDLLREFLPRRTKGHILLTSRAQVFDMLGIAKPIEIDAMATEEAVSFLFTRTGREDNSVAEKKAAAELAEELGGLPLALEQAAASIVAKHNQFREYLVGYRKSRLEFLKEPRAVTGDYPESVATTWKINFAEVDKASAASSDLLRASAFLSPESIPLELITTGRSELGPALSAALVEVDHDPLSLNKVLQTLTRYSFVRLDSDLGTFSIHRLVQEVLRDGMDDSTQRLWVERTIRALNQAFPEVEFANWSLCERFLPHVKVAAKLIERWDITFEGAARLLNDAAFFCYEQGQYDVAEPMYKQSLAISEKALGPDNPDVALRINNLALLFHAQGRYAEAEIEHKRSLAIYERVLGPDDPDVALGLNNLAALYDAQGKYTEAEPLYKRSLEIYEEALRRGDLDVAMGLNNLAELYRARENYNEAEPLYQRSLAIYEKRCGPNHPDVALSLNNLASLYGAQRKYKQAESLFQRSLKIRQSVLRPLHPDVAQSLNNLAELYREQSKYAKAEDLYKQSLTIWENALGLHHPDVATSLRNLALLYCDQRKYDKAEPLLKRCLSIRERAFGSHHLKVAAVLNSYIRLFRATERYAEAQTMEARAEAIRARYSQTNLD